MCFVHMLFHAIRFSGKTNGIVYSVPPTFYVVECGASGHNIRSQPSLKALPVGKFKLGSSFLITEKVLTQILSVYLLLFSLTPFPLLFLSRFLLVSFG